MAKAYLEPTDNAFTVNNHNTTVYGASGDQTVTVVFGVTSLTTDQNIEKVIFSKTSSEYTYKQSGNQIRIYFNDSLVTTIPVQGDSDGTELIFANGSANALLTNGVMTIGKASSFAPIDANTGIFDPKLVIPAPTPTPTPSPEPSPSPSPSPTPDATAPTITSSTPTDDATNVAVGANIVLAMSENVTAVTGKNITIKKTSDNSTITIIDAADAQITIAANVATINPTADLATDTEYYLLVDSGAFKDSSNNLYTGISSTTALSFTTTDTVAPTLTSSVPVDNATAVAVGANIVLTMSEVVTAVTGKNITIKKTSDDFTITTIDATDPQITIVANVVTINPTADLGSSTEYYALVDSGAFKDSSNNDYAGISAATALSFTTADIIAPALTSSTPIDNATNVAVGANIVLNFSENIIAVTGKNIIIKKTSDNSIVTTIDAANAQITGSGGAVITINPTSDLDANTEYYALIDSGAFKDSANNDYAGISSTTALSFKSDPVVYLAKIAAGTVGFIINGEANSDSSGRSVSNAGDVNGDGLSDILIGALYNDASATDAGRSYVVFGKSNTTAVSLSSLSGGGGFAINGEAAAGDNSGWSVSSAGDVNGDGLSDLIVGAWHNDIGGADSGRSYVVFGKSDTTTINLSAIASGTGGFAINGEAVSDQSGYSVSSAGDVNGDGLADLIVGARYNNATGADSGRSYVVFGKSGGSAVSLSTIASGTGGFAINGEAADDNSGGSVSGAGDVNGDGLADLIIGAPLNDAGALSNAGRSYVVFGKSATTAVNLSALGTGGFVIDSEAAGDYSGSSVSSAGDVNGDGLADLIVSSGGNDTGGTNVGRAYVVFGKSTFTSVSLSTVAGATGGFAINVEPNGDSSAFTVSGAGDINGDGLADLIVGAYSNDTGGADVGRSYVIFGKADGTTVSTATIATGVGGFAINGEAAGDLSGFSISNGGDINGDGLADLIVGSDRAEAGGTDRGKTYIIFGSRGWLTTSVSATGTAADEAMSGSSFSDTLTGGGGIDRFYSGDGDDVIVLATSDITNLSDNTITSQKAMINGGGDIDTVRLTAGANLDLTAIANQGAGGVEENSRIESIEKIDMATDTAANILTLTVNDVIDMSGMNLFNTGNGWTNGSYAMGSSVSKHQIIVDADATDSLIINAGNGVWANDGNVTNGAATYDVYNNILSNTQILVLSGAVVTNNDA